MQQIKEIRARIENELRARFPATFNFDRKQTAYLIGCVPGHLSNSESKDRPIINPVTSGKNKKYPFNRVVDYLVDQQIDNLKPKRGRPKKTEQYTHEARKGDMHAN